jgi:hypothetical protein
MEASKLGKAHKKNALGPNYTISQAKREAAGQRWYCQRPESLVYYLQDDFGILAEAVLRTHSCEWGSGVEIATDMGKQEKRRWSRSKVYMTGSMSGYWNRSV